MKYQQTAPTTQVKTQAASRPTRKPRAYNPAPIRRCVRRVETTPEIACGITKSFTREEDNIKHEPKVDLVTGECHCSCENFFYERNPLAKKLGIKVSIKTPLLHCKHLERFIEGCVRRGELTRDAGKVLHLNHPQAAPVEKIVVPPHIDPETGELKPGYLPNGEWDYGSYFD